jgi:hypothetical protein
MLSGSQTISTCSKPIVRASSSIRPSDSAQQFGAVDNPSVGAMSLSRVDGDCRIGLVDEAIDPRSEPLSRLGFVVFAEPETVLVLS